MEFELVISIQQEDQEKKSKTTEVFRKICTVSGWRMNILMKFQ